MNHFMTLLGEPSSLWASLLGLIAVALAVVLTFNALQGRQRRQREASRQAADQVSVRADVSPPRSSVVTKRQARPDTPRSEVPVSDLARSPSQAVSDSKSLEPGGRIEPTLDSALAVPVSPQSDEPSTASQTSPQPPAQQAEPASLFDRLAQGGARTDTGVDPALAPINLKASAAKPAPSAQPAVTERTAVFAELPLNVLDPRIDCIVEMRLREPISVERIVKEAGSLRRIGSKPVLIEVDTDSGQWRVLHSAQGNVRRLRVGLLLANRHGPLNAMEFSEFSDAVEPLGQALEAADVRLPLMEPVLEHARQVDEYCAQLDNLIGVNVQMPKPLSGAELQSIAESLGLIARGNNRYARMSDSGDVLFSMALGDRSELVTLLLDVPRAPAQARPWSTMLECGRKCAALTDGQLVDDALRPLTDSAASAVARQLESHYRSLDEAGLGAGSPAALRVFN
jgi:FtsZ-interacting cell division protein ZipA